MRHGRRIRKLGVKTDHRKAMLRNMATSLISYGRIETTLARAKALAPFVARLIGYAKRGDLHARRLAAASIRDNEVLKKLFGEVADELKDRKGGFTRIVRDGYRRGDGAEMAIVELLVTRKVKEEKAEKDKKAEKSADKRSAAEAEATTTKTKKEKKKAKESAKK